MSKNALQEQLTENKVEECILRFSDAIGLIGEAKKRQLS